MVSSLLVFGSLGTGTKTPTGIPVYYGNAGPVLLIPYLFIQLKSKKVGKFEKLLGFARSHSFLNLNGSIVYKESYNKTKTHEKFLDFRTLL